MVEERGGNWVLLLGFRELRRVVGRGGVGEGYLGGRGREAELV